MTTVLPALSPITFIGGGNMAQALIAGLRKQGTAADSIRVVEPLASTRQLLMDQQGVQALPQANDSLSDTQLVTVAENVSASDIASELTSSQLNDIANDLDLADLAGELDTDKMMENYDLEDGLRNFFQNNSFSIRP